LSSPSFLFLLKNFNCVKPNPLPKKNFGQKFFPPPPPPILTCFVPAAASSGRAELVAAAERPHIG